MVVCPSCGRENPDGARFCNACGATLAVSGEALIGAETRLLVRRHDEAEVQVRRALEIAETTDFFVARARARLYLSETLALGGRTGEAGVLAAEAIAISEAKGDITGTARLRERLDELGVVPA